MPIPRPSFGKNVSGTEINRMRTRIVASAPMTMITRLSGTVAGSSMPSSLEDDEHDDREAEEEDELPDHPGVPADDGDRRPLVRARVPAHEGREHEDEPGERGDPLTHRPDPARNGEHHVPLGLLGRRRAFRRNRLGGLHGREVSSL